MPITEEIKEKINQKLLKVIEENIGGNVKLIKLTDTISRIRNDSGKGIFYDLIDFFDEVSNTKIDI